MFKLIKKEEDGGNNQKCFISMFVERQVIKNLIQIEKYVAIKEYPGYYTLEIFSGSIEPNTIESKLKSFYLGDDGNYSSYYLLDCILCKKNNPEIKRLGAVVFIDEIIYLPISLAYDLCVDQKSKTLIESISTIKV